MNILFNRTNVCW